MEVHMIEQLIEAGSTSKLISVKDIAVVSGYSPRTIWDHVRKGALPHVRLGTGPHGRIRVRCSDARVYLFGARLSK